MMGLIWFMFQWLEKLGLIDLGLSLYLGEVFMLNYLKLLGWRILKTFFLTKVL